MKLEHCKRNLSLSYEQSLKSLRCDGTKKEDNSIIKNNDVNNSEESSRGENFILSSGDWNEVKQIEQFQVQPSHLKISLPCVTDQASSTTKAFTEINHLLSNSALNNLISSKEILTDQFISSQNSSNCNETANQNEVIPLLHDHNNHLPTLLPHLSKSPRQANIPTISSEIIDKYEDEESTDSGHLSQSELDVRTNSEDSEEEIRIKKLGCQPTSFSVQDILDPYKFTGRLLVNDRRKCNEASEIDNPGSAFITGNFAHMYYI